MVYKENFVASIRVIGNKRQILREKYGVVRLPFGSEYSIYMKNTNSQRAVVSIFIDGQSIGDDIVIAAHESLDLERFTGGDMHGGRRFKFIEKTQQISEHRGDKIEDGLIEVRYRFEKPQYVFKASPLSPVIHYHHYHPHYPDPYGPHWKGSNATFDSVDGPHMTLCSNVGAHMNESFQDSAFNFMDQPRSIEKNEEGITVEGSDSNQGFQNVHVGALETQEHCITFKLVGVDPTTKVKIVKPITVKLTCPTCGKSTKGKFCDECGTRVRD